MRVLLRPADHRTQCKVDMASRSLVSVLSLCHGTERRGEREKSRPRGEREEGVEIPSPDRGASSGSSSVDSFTNNRRSTPLQPYYYSPAKQNQPLPLPHIEKRRKTLRHYRPNLLTVLKGDADYSQEPGEACS